jgi:hypothetical protein
VEWRTSPIAGLPPRFAHAVQRGIEVKVVTADQSDVLANINRATATR